MTQEVYDHGYLVVHLSFFLQGGEKHGMSHTNIVFISVIIKHGGLGGMKEG